ncbi:MAG: Asp-tRNA(Asn)/Glu-tRNA(Gln) amidotransferase subunit GatA [Pirellulales bacterium]
MNNAAPKLESLSAVELGKSIAAGELSSRQVVEHFLARAQSKNSATNAFVSFSAERALSEADAIDARRRSGECLPLLAGVPIAVKDVLCTAGETTTCCSNILRDFRPPYDASVIERCKQHGLIAIGKTNMDEFAMGGSTENTIFGPTRNPWDTSRTAGGSSGGSAAATAACMAPLALGTDTGGSVRQPAAFCGVFGLKPTYGRVSRFGLIAFASSLDQVGPFARSTADLAALLQVIAGHDGRDSTSLNVEVEDYSAALNRSMKGIRVGIVRAHLESPGLNPDVARAVQTALDHFKQAGAQIVEVELPHADASVPTYYVIAPCEASSNLARYDGAHYGFRAELKGSDASLENMYCRSRSQGFGSEVKRRIMLGTFALSAGYYDAYYRKALQVRRLISQDYRSAFEQVDFILGPTTASTAFKLGEKLDDPVQMYLEDLYTVGANLAGIPALSIPAPGTSGGLPIGIQLQGPPLSEAGLLAAAHYLESAGFQSQQIAE